MDIEIPSPSIFLQRTPPGISPVHAVPIRKSGNQRGITSAKVQTKPNVTNASLGAQKAGIAKPKQSKSRNGCMTCKKKRLKCDETKPTCVQCDRRNVDCEGYRKDYKWRSFEETSKHSRLGKAKKDSITDLNFDNSQTMSRPTGVVRARKENTTPQIQSSSLRDPFSFQTGSFIEPQGHPRAMASAALPNQFNPSHLEPVPILNPGFSPFNIDLRPTLPYTNRSSFGSSEDGHRRSPLSSGSPTLADLLIPGTDMSQPPDSSELRPPMSPLPYQPGLADSPVAQGIIIKEDDDFDEEVIRNDMDSHQEGCMSDLFDDQVHTQMMTDTQWIWRPSSPALSEASTTSSRSTTMSILRPPSFDPSSPEMLMLRFDKETCGILSIKDGGSENPWRNAIWPLAKDSPALYHAVSSMAALHGATHNPQLRLAGMAHMTKSISRLATEIGTMSLDQALATSLALALGEGWDDKVSTGIQHLKGARVLVSRAVAQRSRNQRGHIDAEDAKRLRFLCNTYVYMDVIARLASVDGDAGADHGRLIQTVNEPFSGGPVELDPLMGCATTLFPLIGKVASLVQRVRSASCNSLKIVSEANELKEQILNWHPPYIELLEQSGDPYSQTRDAMRTAEAYQHAIILHLHQAVPELATESAHAQAKQVLTIIASTPLSSRTMIIQIFPLLVGSCEMVSSEDREWVCQRWGDMMRRLSIVNVESCFKLVQEVWSRRDIHREEQARRSSARNIGCSISSGMVMPLGLKRKLTAGDVDDIEQALSNPDQDGILHQDGDGRPLKRRLTFDTSTAFNLPGSGGGSMLLHGRRPTNVTGSSIDPEYTVRGHLHWLGVMSSWQWEVFLG